MSPGLSRSVLSLLAALSLGAMAAPRGVAPAKRAVRELQRRTLTITDSTRDSEVHVAGGTIVTLTFPSPLEGALLPDARGLFEEPRVEGRLVVLLPKSDVAPAEAVAMTVTLQDGTVLPPFLLVTRPGVADLAIDVDVRLDKKASADSAAGLRLQIAELQARVDACNEQAKGVGAVKVAELVLAQEANKPTASVVERHDVHARDKQSGLFVETRAVYRLFEYSYLLATVENRDPDKTWVLDSAHVSVDGGGSTIEARVVHVAREFERLAPGVEEKLVVVFETPPQNPSHRYTLRLQEAGGSRHVELKGLKL